MTYPDTDDDAPERELFAKLGRIDIYVFDQIARGRLTSSMRILDAGCGGGRNSEYLMRCGADVHGVDAAPEAVARIREIARTAAPELPEHNFSAARLDRLPFPDTHFDAVVCSAVLHFSEDHAAFERAMWEMWRVLRPAGLFFARLASSIGMEDRVAALGDGWFRLPDGSDRFLVDEAYLLDVTSRLGARQLDPLKTTLVQDMRSMTTWVLEKS